MGQARVGVQLIVFGERTKQDLSGVAREVAKAGFDGLEAGTILGREEVEEMGAALKEGGVSLVGGHTSIGQCMEAGHVREMAAAIRELGGGLLMTSGNYQWDEMEQYRESIKGLNEAGRICRDAGLKFCYHNHHWEFRDIGGVKAIHYLAAETDPELVKLCPDIYWVHVGGEKPAEFIARYTDRCPVFHFKDGLAGENYREFRELGNGAVDVPAALEAALACDPEWIVVEQDRTDKHPAEASRISREYLRGLGL